MDSAEDAKWPIASRIHYICGLLLLFQTVVVDGIWLFPRNPISFILPVIISRTLTLLLPVGWYQTLGLSHFFDGDGSILILVIWITSLSITGGLNKNVLWPKRRFRRFLTLVILVNPLFWFIKYYHVLKDAERIVQIVDKEFGSSEGTLFASAYDIYHQINNKYGAKPNIEPNLTLIYKEVSKKEIGCDFHHTPFAIPGDIAFQAILEKLWDGKLEIDVYKPRVQRFKLAPIVLHIHGGGWKRGHRRFISMNYHGGLPYFLLEHGYMIVSVSYRLLCSPINTMTQLKDVYDATRYIIANAESWGEWLKYLNFPLAIKIGGDGQKLAVMGTSAGGHLAMLLAYKYDIPQIKGVFNFYGVTEVREKHIYGMTNDLWGTHIQSPIFTRVIRRICHGIDDEMQEKCFEELSPLHHISARSPTTITIHGWQDSLVNINQAIALDAKLKAHNVTHIPVFTQGNHDCDCFVSSACGQGALFAIFRFLESQLDN